MDALDRGLSAIDGLAAAAGRLRAGTVVYPPGGTCGPRWQPNYQLVLLHRGGLVVEIDGTPFSLSPGEVALLKPGRREFFQFSPQTDSHHSWLALQHPPLPPAALSALEAAPFALPISPAMASLLSVALGLEASHPLPRGPLLGVLTAAFTLYLQESHGSGPSGGATRVREHPAIAAVRSLIRQRAEERLTLRDLAGAAHVAPEYLVRLFRRELGTTPMRSLWSERVRHGVHLLEQTGLPIAEVASRTGFQTVYHFSRLVRTASGLPPRALRKRSETAAETRGAATPSIRPAAYPNPPS